MSNVSVSLDWGVRHVIWKPFRVAGLQLTAPTGLWRWSWIFCSNETWRSSRQNQRSCLAVERRCLYWVCCFRGGGLRKTPPHTRWEQAPFPFSVFLSEADGWQPWWRCFSLSHCSCDRREPAGVWLTEVWIERNRPVEEDVRSLMNCFSSCLLYAAENRSCLKRLKGSVCRI